MFVAVQGGDLLCQGTDRVHDRTCGWSKWRAETSNRIDKTKQFILVRKIVQVKKIVLTYVKLFNISVFMFHLTFSLESLSKFHNWIFTYVSLSYRRVATSVEFHPGVLIDRENIPFRYSNVKNYYFLKIELLISPPRCTYQWNVNNFEHTWKASAF